MTFVRRISLAAGLAALWLGLAAPAPAAAEKFEGGPPYPVWWSPALELDSLEAIDARLERQLWSERDEGMPLIKIEGDEREDVSAANCLELRAFDEQGYYGAGSHDQWVQQYLLAQCRAIEWMRRARPAERSFLRDFVLDEEAIHVLPAMVDISPSCDFLCRQNVANERRIPLSEFEPVFRVTVAGNEEMEIRTLGAETDLSILARGDFNDDGLDDLVLLASTGATEGTWAGAEIYLVSREAPGAVLEILETGTAVCTDYQCQESYDYPEALKDIRASPPSQITIPVRGAHTPSHSNDGAYPVWWSPSPGTGTIGRFDPQPSKGSFLRNLTLDEDALDVLPALLGFWPDRCIACRALAFNDQHLSWRKLNEELAAKNAIPTFRDGRAYQVEVGSHSELIAHGLLWRVTLNISGGGDVNGDGLEDLIIERRIEHNVVVYEDTEQFVLTRDSPDGPLRVINADDTLEGNQQCGGSYAHGGDYWQSLQRCAMSDAADLAATSEDPNETSIWCPDDLEFKNLLLIDARLKRPFEDFGGTALAMDTWPKSEQGPVYARSCEELQVYLDRDYGIVSDHHLGDWQVKRCEAIRKLKEVRPATISYLAGFTLDRTMIGKLPALVDLYFSGTTACRRYLYNTARFTWREFDATGGLGGTQALAVSDTALRILRISDQEALAVNEEEAAHLKVLARGDFNGDGLDDILLEATFWKKPAESYDPLSFDLRQFLKADHLWLTSGLYVLSRDCPDGPLWMVDADRFLGTSGFCDDWLAESLAYLASEERSGSRRRPLPHPDTKFRVTIQQEAPRSPFPQHPGRCI